MASIARREAVSRLAHLASHDGRGKTRLLDRFSLPELNFHVNGKVALGFGQ